MQETTDFLLELGRALGTEAQAKAFIAQEKRETLLPIWDIWLGAPQDFYSTTKIAIVANESYALGLKRFLGEELGLQIGTVINRQKSNDTNNYMMRNRLISERPTIMSGFIWPKPAYPPSLWRRPCLYRSSVVRWVLHIWAIRARFI